MDYHVGYSLKMALILTQMTIIQSKACYEDRWNAIFLGPVDIRYKILMKDLLLNVGLSSILFRTYSNIFLVITIR